MSTKRLHAPSTAFEGLRVLWRDANATCWICERHVEYRDASRDHVTPLGRIAGDEIRLAHKVCNSTRGHLSVEAVDRIKADNPDVSLRVMLGLLATERSRLSHQGRSGDEAG